MNNIIKTPFANMQEVFFSYILKNAIVLDIIKFVCHVHE